MKKVNLLSKAEMKNVMGGVGAADICKDKVGIELSNCRYNLCISESDFNAHTPKANDDKVNSCYAMAGHTSIG